MNVGDIRALLDEFPDEHELYQSTACGCGCCNGSQPWVLETPHVRLTIE